MRKGRFCPKCGKKTEEFHDGLCGECFGGRIELPEEIPEKIVVGTCRACGKIFMGKDRFDNVERSIEAFLEDVLGEKGVTSATYRISGGMLFLTTQMEVDGVQKEVQKEVPIVHKTITCEFCNLKRTNYYNSTIQVRVPKGILDEVVGEIQNQIARLNRTDNYAFVAGIVRKKEGVDIKVGSKSAVSHVVKYLKSKYRIETKISRTLYGPILGKKTYRDTVLVSMGD